MTHTLEDHIHLQVGITSFEYIQLIVSLHTASNLENHFGENHFGI